jgi:hypothetical protein
MARLTGRSRARETEGLPIGRRRRGDRPAPDSQCVDPSTTMCRPSVSMCRPLDNNVSTQCVNVSTPRQQCVDPVCQCVDPSTTMCRPNVSMCRPLANNVSTQCVNVSTPRQQCVDPMCQCVDPSTTMCRPNVSMCRPLARETEGPPIGRRRRWAACLFDSQCVDPSMLSDLATTGRTGADHRMMMGWQYTIGMAETRRCCQNAVGAAQLARLTGRSRVQPCP